MLKSRDPYPLDRLTGLPLSILYGPEHLNLPMDYNHAWISRRQISKKYRRIVGLALHASRGQAMPMKFHWHTPQGIHVRLGATELPASEDGVYERVVNGAAGVFPRRAVDLRSTKVRRYVTLNNTQFAFLSDPKRTYVENNWSKEKNRERSRNKISRFLTYYGLSKMKPEDELTTLSAELREEEIKSGANGRITAVYREVGSLMYGHTLKTLHELLEPVQGIYNQANREGMVPETALTPSETLISYLPEHRFGNYFRQALDVWLPEELARNADVVPLQTEVANVELAPVSTTSG